MVQRKTNLPVIPQRKPIRPIERQKMRPWLVNLLNNERITGFSWVSKDQETFRISWRHAARQGWDPEVDAGLFERWAKHTGTLNSLNRLHTSVELHNNLSINIHVQVQVYFLYSLQFQVSVVWPCSVFYCKWVLMNSSVINLSWFCSDCRKVCWWWRARPQEMESQLPVCFEQPSRCQTIKGPGTEEGQGRLQGVPVSEREEKSSEAQSNR